MSLAIAATLITSSGVTSLAAAEKVGLAIEVSRAFPNLKIRRPVVITNAGDGSDRLFVVTQQGIINSFAADQNASEVNTFLDIEDRVVYKDNQNEEGFLGMCFHPKYKENGQFFVYYTTTDAPLTSVVSRFRVSKDDPNKADPDSEEELMRIKQPYWNHNGGTIEFGPDGYLYIALGDGGSGRDPHGNGQNLGTLLGSMLRIDVDHHDKGRAYAIPKDNPFVGKEGARGEIWAHGLRNVWRFSFDRETGECWAGDVGQDFWEEINIITRGGNYGWNLREANHKFGDKGVGPRDDLIEPILEYHHDVGKSITGGNVYRGKRLPQLTGHYLYADYVSGIVWALKYNHDKKQVVANHEIPYAAALDTDGIPQGDEKDADRIPVMTFGEDEQGEVYFSDPSGRLFRFTLQRQ